jgi:phosphohistidine phosphatase
MNTIELYFFRHGIAVDREDATVTSDADRPLTDEGRRKTRSAAKGLERLELGIDRILTSPWLRALETADIVADVLGMDRAELPELAGNRSVDELLGALSRQRDERVLLVGHEPLLGNTVGRLLCSGADFRIDLKKSGVCAVQLDALPPRGPATLLWLLTSRQLRMMANKR